MVKKLIIVISIIVWLITAEQLNLIEHVFLFFLIFGPWIFLNFFLIGKKVISPFTIFIFAFILFEINIKFLDYLISENILSLKNLRSEKWMSIKPIDANLGKFFVISVILFWLIKKVSDYNLKIFKNKSIKLAEQDKRKV